MIEKLFTNKCMTLVGANGRALTADALDAAEQAIQDAKMSGHKLWTDRDGNFYHKERTLFATSYPLVDRNGNQVRICGRLVKTKAKFCSRCGGSAPGSWWRCGGCGKLIGVESKNCPHCGREQNPIMRLDIINGTWRKDEDTFSERFELQDVASKIENGVSIQESQCAILLEGGAVVCVLSPGFYKIEDITGGTGGEKSLIMVDNSEFVLPVCIDKVLTKDDIEADLHIVSVLRFSPEDAKDFMCNLMGNSLYLKDDALTSALGYDEIAHCILGEVDSAAREFCNSKTVAELFKSADTRLELEKHISSRLGRNLSAFGMRFIRLREVEFESEVFAKLRSMSGEVETKRKEIEYMMQADELANDAVRREALNEHEIDDYMTQLAHEKGIKDELRIQETERLKRTFARQTEKEDLAHENDLDDLQQASQLERDRIDANFQQEMLDLEHKKELERRIAEQNASLEFMQVETQIQDIKLEIEKKKVAAEQEATEGWLKIKQQKQSFNQNLKIDMMKAAAGADIQALLMAEDDPDKRKDLLALHEQQLQSKMTPELLLAAAAARGNAAAAEALSRMNREQLEVIEKAKNENKEVYEHMLQMNERLFSSALESAAKGNSGSAPVTQVIK